MAPITPKGGKPDRNALFNSEPTALDRAIHGRNIYATQYGQFWQRTVYFLANYAAGTLYASLARSEVKFSLTASKTACVDLKTKKIFINPTFFRNWISTPSDMAGLLLHEMMHPIIDPDMKFVRDGYDNIATDALINSTMFRISPVLCSLLKKFYTLDQFCDSLLRPGARKQWRNALKEHDAPTYAAMPGMECPTTSIHFEVYKSLYPSPREAKTAVRPGVEEILEKFFPDLQKKREEAAKNGKVVVCPIGDKTLGSGGGGKTITLDDLKKITPNQKAEIEALIEQMDDKFPDPNQQDKGPESKDNELDGADPGAGSGGAGGGGAGKTGTLEDKYTDIAAKEELFKEEMQTTLEDRMRAAKDIVEGIVPQYSKNAFRPNEFDALSALTKRVEEFYIDTDIIEAFNKASVHDEQGEIVDALEFKITSNRSFLPFAMTRSAVALIANDEMPTIWRRNRRQKEQEQKATRIYVDFSGSMSSQIPWCMRLLVEMQRRCHSDIYSFSTEIAPTTIQKIEAGEYSTTGGTSFNDVIRHFIEECDSEQCLVITDGQDHVSDEWKEKLTKSGKRVFGLLVETHTPSSTYVVNMQSWCRRLFLKERKWWDALKMVPK